MKVNLLPASDNRNGWLEILPPLAPANAAVGNISVDYAIIGGGFTGLAAARRLADLNPSVSIALIDAGRIGNNAAGRCSGFAIDQAHNIRAKDFAGSLDEELRQLALNRAGQDYMRETVITQAIECDWREDGKFHGAATERGKALLQNYTGNLDLLEVDYRWVDAAEMKAVTGIPFYNSALYTPGTVQIQPAAMVTGFARTMPQNVSVYEDSPVTEISYGKTHRIKVPQGEFSAHTVLLTNNGFAPRFGFYNHCIIPVSTWASMTRKLTPDEVAELGGTESWGIIPSDPFGSSVRRTVDDRILVRNIYSYSRGVNPEEHMLRWVRKKHSNSFHNRFPMLSEVEFEFTWGGALALSQNNEPVFGELADRVFGSFCHNGVGISRGTICGKLLAELISGETSELLEFMLGAGRPNRLPPRPFLGWGARMNFAFRRSRAGREL